MTYFSLTFLLLFFPACMLLYFCTPGRMKNLVLLLLSLFFYATLDRTNFTLLIITVVFDYGMGALIRFGKERRGIAGLAMAMSVVKTVGVVFYSMMRLRAEGVPAPVGVLVYMLSSTGYVLDLYRGDFQFEQNILRFLLYNCFFGRIIIGPYAAYSAIRPQLRHPKLSLSSVSTGIVLLIQGVAKKVVLADNLLAAYNKIAAIEARDMTLLAAWLMILFLALTLYFHFSAFCSIARGLGQIFCFKLPRNVFYPLHCRSVREFTARLNSTFFDYLQRYVYQSLGGSAYGVLSDCCNTVLVMMLYGTWFGLTPNCVVWGVCLAMLLLGEKYLYGRLLRRLPGLFSRLYTYLAVLLSLSLLACGTLAESRALLDMLFTFEMDRVLNDPIVYILTQDYWVLILGTVLSFPIMSKVSRFTKRRFPAFSNFAAVAINVGILFVSLMFLI